MAYRISPIDEFFALREYAWQREEEQRESLIK
jgi:hypothetical protein